MKVLFVVNVWRGRRQPQQRMLDSIERLFDEFATEREIFLSETVEQSMERVRGAREDGFDTLWIGGGDGTVNALLNQSIGRGFSYGIVPMGTINALARCIGIPHSPVAAARYLLQASPVKMDVGRVNERHFLCFASVGFDAAVVHGVDEASKARLGRFAYLFRGLRQAASPGRLPKLEIELNNPDTDQTVTASAESVILSNLQDYAGLRMFHRVRPASGKMELYLLKSSRFATLAGLFGGAALGVAGWHKWVPGVEHHEFSRMRVRGAERLHLQLDGDAVSLGADRDYVFEVLPGAVQVLLNREGNQPAP
ncbi:MAG: hypothetical protein K1X53_08025 [Candidatus Sumerlaeaceae bacterium]|nr:hypothetical protein [Candidatus Sumerlaeaceae bacterium]